MARPTLISCLVIGLTLAGLLTIASASTITAFRDFGDKWYYLKLQFFWATIGLALFFIGRSISYHRWEKTALTWLLVAMVSLVVVLIPGLGTKVLGARRWISLGSFSFQPAELVKFTLCIYLAGLLKAQRPGITPFVLVVAVIATLIMLQPDLGTTTVIIGISLVFYFGSGQKLRYLGFAAPVVALVLALLILVSPYRRDRVLTYFNSQHDPQGASYHIRQALLSLGSGGLFGVGFGQSRQKYEFLPEVTTDSIFAVIAEEWGFIGSSILILTYVVLVMQGLEVSRSAATPFGSLLGLGITSWIAIQSATNLAAMVALFPLTGVPLPYISYGGTSLVLTLFASGILVNIARKP